MTIKSSSTEPRVVQVREVPIELCQFIKFGGLAESGGAAKQLVAEGSVALNGVVETRKRKQLVAGDRVTVAGQTIVVGVAAPSPVQPANPKSSSPAAPRRSA
jgi:ribosome-associated protein